MSINWTALVRELAQPTYPLIETTPDRIQIIIAEPSELRYAMAIRNSVYGHWNAYVLVHSRAACCIEDVVGLPCEYMAPAGKGVTWMGPTQKGKLKIPMQLIPDSDGDFWVGYSIPRSAEWEAPRLIEELIHYEELVRIAARDHCSISG